METGALLAELVTALLLAFAAGALVVFLRQPVIIGYLLAGLAIGPFALGLVKHVEQVQLLAEIGVAFLMFSLGVEISLKELQQVRRVALFGGAAQILLTMGLGLFLGLGLGWQAYEALFFGALIALSSTMVVLKLLMDRGEIEAIHGRIAIGILIVQDLSVVPLMIVLPALAGAGADLPLALGIAGLRAAGLLVVTLFLGIRVVPKLLFWAASTRSRELFLLSIVAICLGTAIATYQLGLSIAFGAFLGGMIVSESVFRHEILAEVRPLRDIFSIVFFVSVGMLITPSFILENAPVVLSVVLAIILGKFIIVFLLAMLFGYSGKVATYSALALVQIGEFSFVLAKLGADRGLISNYLYSLTLTSALLTILLTPFIMQLGPRLVRWLSRWPLLETVFERIDPGKEQSAGSLSQHVVICGHGDVGRNLASVLEGRRFKYFAIDNDPHEIQKLRARKVPCVYGDAANSNVLAQANLPKAKVLAITVSNPITTELIIKQALQINPKLDIIARASSSGHMELLRQSGATAVVEPKFEAGLEIIRHTLHRYGVSSPEILMLVNRMRLDHYLGVLEEASGE